MHSPLPVDKFNFPSTKEKTLVVLVATGSYNPPTYMHLRMLELARDALNSEGYHVIGGYLSPVNDAYKKRGLISAEHRIHLCQLACKSSDFIMVDRGRVPSGYARLGSDLLESIGTPGVWIPEQVQALFRDFGVACIRREGQDVEKIILSNDILNENKNNIKIVDELISNQISSTRIRDCIARGLSVKYLTADEVIDYIRKHKLYLQ